MKKNRAMRLVSMVLAISTLLVPLRVFAATAGGIAAPSASSIASTITTSASLTNAQIATATQAISNGEITVVYDFSRLVDILNSLGVLS